MGIVKRTEEMAEQIEQLKYEYNSFTKVESSGTVSKPENAALNKQLFTFELDKEEELTYFTNNTENLLNDILQNGNAENIDEKIDKLLNFFITESLTHSEVNIEKRQELLKNVLEEYCQKNNITSAQKEKFLEKVNQKIAEKLKMLNSKRPVIISKPSDSEIEERARRQFDKILLSSIPDEKQRQAKLDEIMMHTKKYFTAAEAAKNKEERLALGRTYLLEMDRVSEGLGETIFGCWINDRQKINRDEIKGTISGLGKVFADIQSSTSKSEEETTEIIQQNQENTCNLQASFTKGFEKAVLDAKKDITEEEAEECLSLIKDASLDTLAYLSEELPEKMGLPEVLKAKIKDKSEKIKEKLEKEYIELKEKFWASEAGQRCIEYTKKIIEYRVAEKVRRFKEVRRLKNDCVEKEKQAKLAQAQAAKKKEEADKIKKEISSKQDELKNKLKLSYNFKLTDEKLKFIDMNLANKKKYSDNEYAKARKQVINAESDMRLANKFLEFAKKMASYEQAICNVYTSLFR